MVKIVWTEVAIQDLKTIFDFIAGNSSRHAGITANRIYQKVQLLTHNPEAGRIVPELNRQSVRELIEGNYRIIYKRRSKSQVDILRIYHSTRLMRKIK